MKSFRNLVIIVVLITSIGLLSDTSSKGQKILPNSTGKYTITSNAGLKGNIYLIVNSTIHSAINSSLQQYIQDAKISGYNVTTISWSSTDVTALKARLQTGYTNGLDGALLIGDLPHARYFLPAATIGMSSYPNDLFPCDLYLMDLDGTWISNPPFIPPTYDNHTGNRAPEIWVARINPTSLVSQNRIQLINDYFERVRAYKNGTLTRIHRALLYIDDTWVSWSDEWEIDMLRAYSDTTMINTTIWTNSTNYKSRLTENYEWIWLLSHSNQTHHAFGSSWGSEGYVNYSEIKSIIPNALFYNLFCCYGADYSYQNNIGTQYLFSNNSLIVLGSTKTGGLLWGEDLYSGLRQNQTFGHGFATWFTNSPRGIADHYASYGIVLLGDPLLTIYHDVTAFPPEVSCSTHPNPSNSYDTTTATFNWSYADDISGFAGSYIALDTNIDTDPSNDGTWVTTTTASFTDLKNGTHYFHIVAKDNANCKSSLVTYQINVNIESQESSSSSTTKENSTPGFTFTVIFLSIPILCFIFRRKK